MLLGKSYHLLDLQRRVTIPKSMRGELGATPILTRGLDGGLLLLPETFWSEFVNNLETQPFTKKRSRDFIRLISNEAAAVEPDRLGRITISESLAQLARLQKDVVIVGSLRYVEIWDREKYHEYVDGLSGEAEAIAESLEWDGDYAR